MQYLASIPYSVEARKKKIQGTVYIQFIVEKDGSLTNFEVARSSGSEMLDNATIEHMKKMDNWKPGMQDGNPVRVSQVLPMKFKLS